MAFSKISIAILYLRLTVVTWHRYLLYLVALVSICAGVMFIFFSMLQCQPASYFWDKLQDGGCVDPSLITALTYLYSGLSLFCDFAYAILPIFMICGLQMRLATKIAVVSIMGMGCLFVFAITTTL